MFNKTQRYVPTQAEMNARKYTGRFSEDAVVSLAAKKEIKFAGLVKYNRNFAG